MLTQTFLFEVALKTTALFAAASLAAFLLKSLSAAARHQLWTLAFAAVLVLPFLSTWLPALPIPLNTSSWGAPFTFRATVYPSMAEPRPVLRNSPKYAEASSSVNWDLILPTVWAVGALLSLTQLLISWAALARLRKDARPSFSADFASLKAQLSITAEVDLLESSRASMPLSCGIFRPAILLPGESLEWTPERRNVVLAHELAHIRRADVAKHIFARASLALYWWHPLAWFAWREFLKERELAADDLVLDAGVRPSTYAKHLVDIACSTQSLASPSVTIAMVRPSQLETRVAAILDPTRNRQMPPLAAAVAAVAISAAALLPVAALRAAAPFEAPATTQSPVGSPQQLLKDANTSRDNGKFKQAQELYKQALAAAPAGELQTQALLGLGKTALSLRDFNQAASYFERANTHDAALWLAVTKIHQGQFEDAHPFFETALAGEPPNSPAAATILELQAILFNKQHRDAEASSNNERVRAIRMSLPAPPPSDAYRIGGDVKPPRLISKVEPQYTEDARIALYQGTVLLAIEIAPDGTPHNILVNRALGFGLDIKAVQAVSKWKFEPATRNGYPVNVAANVEVNFRLF